jgi:8-oxo-dGTP pyrophosphatase MutT (NUDIX family)
MTELRIRQAVRALLVTPDEHILLVRFEFPDATVWSLPGGGIDPGESDLDALHRELIEEVGLRDPVVGNSRLEPRTHHPHLDGLWDGQQDRYYLVEASERFDPARRSRGSNSAPSVSTSCGGGTSTTSSRRRSAASGSPLVVSPRCCATS